MCSYSNISVMCYYSNISVMCSYSNISVKCSYCKSSVNYSYCKISAKCSYGYIPVKCPYSKVYVNCSSCKTSMTCSYSKSSAKCSCRNMFLLYRRTIPVTGPNLCSWSRRCPTSPTSTHFPSAVLCGSPTSSRWLSCAARCTWLIEQKGSSVTQQQLDRRLSVIPCWH